MEKTIEIKAIDKEKALKRALNILGVELTENEAVEIIEKVKPRKKFFLRNFVIAPFVPARLQSV